MVDLMEGRGGREEGDAEEGGSMDQRGSRED
jgi:hypothetical protein